MAQVQQLGRVIIPVSDQDAAIAFYTEKLGFTVSTDIPFGENDRWVEVTPSGGGAAIALSKGQGEYQPGRETGIALMSPDPKADHEELKNAGVQVDDELMGGDGVVPLLFGLKDVDGNGLMIVEEDAS
jgi:catechol 2,3-dioxygenase-like lactoylglutathione lyase family enzyme